MARVGSWTVTCESCEHHWTLVGGWSEHERQAVESRPCPRCASYTLSCPEPQPVKPRRSRRLEPQAA